jgi:hypothetical protein
VRTHTIRERLLAPASSHYLRVTLIVSAAIGRRRLAGDQAAFHTFALVGAGSKLDGRGEAMAMGE